MKLNALPEGALDVLLKEYESLREEIKERLKIAFSHVAYAGAIVAFGIPAADKIASALPGTTPAFIFAVPAAVVVLGAILLLWVAWLNMRWVQHCGTYIQGIESRVNEHFGTTVLGWEQYAGSVQARLFLLIPKAPVGLTDGKPADSAPVATSQK